MKSIAVSEYFYSIQGEGSTMGVPSVFLRLSACNLMCGGAGTQNDKKLHDGAKWRCDSIEVWTQSKKYRINELVDKFENEGILHKISMGASLIVTGGEPLMQEKSISDLIHQITIEKGIDLKRVEVETNGTIRPFNSYAYFNVSPKLSNSGMPKEKRIVEDAMKFHSANPTSIFKFVLTEESDFKEMMDDFILPYEIPRTKVWLMAGADNQETLRERAPLISKLAMDHSFNYSSRMQIELWNKTVGV
jgi:organic radical activating enzyme